MRTLIALIGWEYDALAAEGLSWQGTDAAGRPVLLAHLPPGAPAVAASDDGVVHAVLAGSLANARELRASLEKRCRFHTGDDAEIVLQLYRERGLRTMAALRGAFAVAIFDARLGRLVCARDQLGVVPLYVAADRGCLAVSSTLALLTAFPGLTATWDMTAMDALVTFGHVPPPGTLYPAIRQLRPGELGVWEGSGLRRQRYWQLGFAERRLLRQDTSSLFREQMLDAIRMRLTDGPSGLLLSGGLDASALLALTSMTRSPALRAYTLPLGDEDVDAAAKLAAQHGMEHVVLDAEIDWSELVETTLDAHAGPGGDLETAVLTAVAARAGRDVGMVMAGVGAEEVFGGSRPVRVWERLERYRRVPSALRELAELWTGVMPEPWAPELRRTVREARLAPLEAYARGVSLLLPEDRLDLYTEAACEVLGEARPWETLVELFAEAVAAGALETADAVHHVHLVFQLPARAAARVAVAARGVDLRFPFADHRLAQLVASVPAARRGTAEERQLLLRGAVTGLLPRGVLTRPRLPPRPSLRAWREGPLARLLDDTLVPSRLETQGLFRPDAVTRLRCEHQAGVRDHSGLLWTLLLVTRWLERRAVAETPAARAVG